MSLVIIGVAAIATLLGVFVGFFPELFYNKYAEENNSKKVCIVWVIIAVITTVVLISIVNYFLMVKVLGITIIWTFLLFFTTWCIIAMLIAHVDLKWFSMPVLVIVLMVFLGFGPLFSTGNLYNITYVDEVEGKPIGIDMTHIRQVNYEYAKWKADKVIGEQGNKLKLGELEIVLYNGRLTWVCPLVHRGLFKEWDFDITPGYILVDGEDPTREAVMVDTYEIDYAYEGEYFSEYVHRIIYHIHPDYNQYWAFEIDETGAPWIVITLTQPQVYHTGDVAQKVIVMSPINRTYQTYSFGQQPSWIDNAFPEELAEKYCKWWGKYPHGFWNTLFSEEDVKKPTAKVNANPTTDGGGSGTSGTDVYMIVGNNNQTYWFTDFTSPASTDQSMVGYMLMNTKTGEFSFYRANALLNGEAAMEAATAKVTNYQGWYATQPMFLLIDGNETWFTPIHSGTNILQKVALIRAIDGEVILGDTLQDVMGGYDTTPQITVNTSITGNITAIYSYVVDGETEWYITINDSFMVYSYANMKPYLLSVDDNVTIFYQISNTGYEYNAKVAVSIEVN